MPHWDYPKWLRWVPRGWTSFKWKPKQIAGSQRKVTADGLPKPIGESGSWQLSVYPEAPWWAKPFAWYVAYSGEAGDDGMYRHFRFGSRWDDIDDYVTILSVATRKYPAEGERDTTT